MSEAVSRDIIWVWPHRRSMREIAADVAARHGLTLDELKSPQRARRIAWPRQEAMKEIYDTGRFSLPQIGGFFGGRDHTTVLHAIRAHAKRLAEAQGVAA